MKKTKASKLTKIMSSSVTTIILCILILGLLLATVIKIVDDTFTIYESKRTILEEENGTLKAENTVLRAKVKSLEDSNKVLITYSEGLLAASEQKEKQEQAMAISRGSRIREDLSTLSPAQRIAIEQIELENEALRVFYINTTGKDIKEIRRVKIESTMYLTSGGAYPKDSPNYGLMASGNFVYAGAVAAPRGVPFGTTLVFDNPDLKYGIGKRVFTVEDRGGLIIEKEGRTCIDIWIDSADIASDWGRNKKTSGFLIIPEE